MSDITIYSMEQGTPEWHEVRLGIVTASNFGKILAKGKGKTRKNYMLKKAAEILTGTHREGYCSYEMLQGIEQEPEARKEYEFRTGLSVDRIGFATRGKLIGCSPDGLVGPVGGIEIKSVIPETQIETVTMNGLPVKHEAQIQGTIHIMGLLWLDFVSYSPLLKTNFFYCKRVFRDNDYINNLNKIVDIFINELYEMVAKMGGNANGRN